MTDLAGTIPLLLRELTDEYPQEQAFVLGNQSWTYQEWHALVGQVGAGFHALGIGPGSTVGLLATNRAEWLSCLVGATHSGARVAAFNTWLGVWDLEYVLQHSEAETLVTLSSFRTNNYLESLRELIPELWDAEPGSWRSKRFPALRSVVVIGSQAPPPGALNWDDLTAHRELGLGPTCTPDDVAVVLYTSGSTSRPKGVPLIHREMIENGFHIGERMGLTARDRVWISVPLFWSYGAANALMASMTHRSTMLLQETFTAPEALQIIEEQEASAGYFLPHITRAILNDPGFDMNRVSTLRRGLTIGNRDDLRTVAHELGVVDICNVYGSTETYGNCCVTPSTAALEQRLGSQGPPLPGFEIQIVDPDSQIEVPAGDSGEILVGGRISPGYVKDEILNQESFVDGGFFRSGDLGRLREDGWLVYEGRLNEMIKTGGINVSPAEIEEFLSGHSAIREVGVVGVDADAIGQVVVAFVVSDGTVSEEDLRVYCRGKIAGFKVPAEFRFVESLPTTTTGKLSRRGLQDLVRQSAPPE